MAKYLALIRVIQLLTFSRNLRIIQYIHQGPASRTQVSKQSQQCTMYIHDASSIQAATNVNVELISHVNE